MKFIIIFLAALTPTWFEGIRDRKGDSHPNSDWKLRGLLCFITAALSAFFFRDNFWIDTIKYTVSSALLFAALFPYYINWIHLKNGVTTYKVVKTWDDGRVVPMYYKYNLLERKEIFDHIVNHMSDKAWPDKLVWWRQIGWKWRMVINTTFLIAAILLIVL